MRYRRKCLTMIITLKKMKKNDCVKKCYELCES